MADASVHLDQAKGATSSIGGAAILGILGTAATLVFSIVRSKTTAIVLGPEGVGIASEVLQLVALMATPVAIFSGPALVARLSAARAAHQDAVVANLYDCAFTLSGLIALVGGTIAIFTGYFVFPASSRALTWQLTVLASVGSVGTALMAVPSQVLTTAARLRSLTVVGIAIAALQMVFVVAGTIPFGLIGQFSALAVMPFVGLFLMFGALARELPGFRWRPQWILDRSFFRDAVRFGAVSLASAAGLQIVLSTIRGLLETRGGPLLNGHFQAAWAIGGSYFGFVLGGIGNFAFPRYSAAPDAIALGVEVRAAYRFVMRVAPPAILTMIALRTPIVRLFYSSRFDEAIPLMGLMMAADLGRAVIWVQHGPLLYRAKLGPYVFVEMLGVGILCTGVLLLVPQFGLIGVGWAYVATNMSLIPISAWALKSSTGVNIGTASMLSAMAAMAVMLGAALVGDVSFMGRTLMLVCALIWAWRAGILVAAIRRIRSWFAIATARKGEHQ